MPLKSTMIVQDHFLKQPQNFLARAASLPFHRSELIPGNLATARVPWASGLERRFEKILGTRVKWAVKLGSGTYRWTTAREAAERSTQFYAHSDGIHDLVCLLYLSPPQHCHGGTGFYRHKGTRLYGYQELPPVQKIMDRTGQSVGELDAELMKEAHDPSAWTLTDLVEMRCNRLLMYNSRRFHSHIFDFDSVPANAKRWTFACFGQTD